MVAIKAVLRGGPDDGRTVTINSPAPLYLHVPANQQTIISWVDTARGPADIEWPRDRVYHLGASPLEDEETAEYYADDDVAKVARRCPSARSWRRVKTDRFIGEFKPPFDLGFIGICLAANVPYGRTFFWKQAVEDDMPLEHLWWEFEHRIEYELTPPCVVPDCRDKGFAVMTAKEWGLLAGQLWRTGDEIRLCPKHENDVVRVRPGGDEDLPAWLARDATYPYWASGRGMIMKLGNGAFNCGGMYFG